MKDRKKVIENITYELEGGIWEFLQNAIKDEVLYGNDDAETVEVDQDDQGVILTIPKIGRFIITVTPAPLAREGRKRGKRA